MKRSRIVNSGVAALVLLNLQACVSMPGSPRSARRPAEEFSQRVRGTQQNSERIGFQSPEQSPRAGLRPDQYGGGQYARGDQAASARVHMAKDYPGMDYNQEAYAPQAPEYQEDPYARSRNAMHRNPGMNDDVQVYRSSEIRGNNDYNGPLSLGDPGVGSSLWNESRLGNDLYRDYRAFKPMDLITIVVTEQSEGRKEADTQVIEEVDVLAGIASLFNIENSIEGKNPGLDTANLIQANTANEYIGQGETIRRGTLTARISAMVVEVLPSGVMRIEGEKIISVNNEEQVMVVSGLVRTRDVSSINEVDSSKIANLRIDYYGQGVIGDVQSTGWFTRLVSKVWPF